MKKICLIAAVAAAMGGTMVSCTDLDEKVFDRIDSSIYYQDENSVKGAVASVYNAATTGFLEYFWYLNELSADQVAWRSWNGGAWGWDEGQKFVLSAQSWNSESVIIRQAWENAWKTIGLCNMLINDLGGLDAAAMGMSEESKAMYIAEMRTMRAWAYYNNFELWGGTLPLCTSTEGDIPGSASANFDEGCKIIYNFIATELDESYPALMKEDGSGNSRLRINQGLNRMLKMRLLLNSEVFIGEDHYSECATLAQDIIDGDYGNYSLATDYRDIFSNGNTACPEIIFAFAQEDGQLTNNNRNTPFLPYNYDEFLGQTFPNTGWNCFCIVPSKDNSGTVQPNGGTDNPKSFLFDYGDKLGAVYDRFNDADIRKQNFSCTDDGVWNGGIFLKGAMLNRETGEPVLADADRDGMPLVYVDQLGTFLGLGRPLATVMNPRWGETSSGLRLMKYPIFPESTGLSYLNIPEVEFRLAEAYYTLAECRMRAGDANGAKELVDDVRARYFTDQAALDEIGPDNVFGTAPNMDWLLSEWGIEFLNEGRRRRTDLRRFDKFTQGQWWFFGRDTETGYDLSAQRDRRYEWFPLPEAALMVNPGLVQNPNY